MSPQQPTIAEVRELLKVGMSSLHPVHRRILANSLVVPRLVPVADHPGEYVVVVAELDGKVLYWADGEEGWELEELNSNGGIQSRGANQFELSHIMYQAKGMPNAV